MVQLKLKNIIIQEDMEQVYKSRKNWNEFENATIYITGATGMIASYFTLFLIYLNEFKDYHINIIAGIRNSKKASIRFGEYINKSYFTIFESDITNINIEMIKPDYIVHAASLASPQYYGKYPVETMLPNILGTHRLLEMAKINQCKGMLFFSSGSVYGSVTDVVSLTEDVSGPLKFLELGNSYGESKRCGEALCSAYYHEYNVPVKIARIHHTYGPSMDYINDKRVFSDFVNCILSNQNIVLKSDGSAKRSFCYLSDMIAGLLMVLLDGENGQPYNIANETQYVTIAELAQQLVFLYPEKELCVLKQFERFDDYCPSNEKRIIPTDCGKIEFLGWNAKVNITSGFKRTIDYLGEQMNEGV